MNSQISIYVPTFNAESTIKICIKSNLKKFELSIENIVKLLT